jgi:hypothetical protein
LKMEEVVSTETADTDPVTLQKTRPVR